MQLRVESTVSLMGCVCACVRGVGVCDRDID